VNTDSSQILWNRFAAGACGLGLLLACACSVGPRYARPSAPAAPVFKETPPDWKTAQPLDASGKGKWWEVFQDSQLDPLEDRIDVSNQSLKSAQAAFEQARDLVRINRAGYYPTVSTNPSGQRVRQSTDQPNGTAVTQTMYSLWTLPVEASYEVDVWGRVRHTVQQARASAQASAGDLESVRLSLHAELASDYFQLRALDAQAQLLDSTVSAYERALELTQNRYHGGVASQVDVAQAQTQLETTRAQAIDVRVQRAQLEHAIAVLMGVSPADFSLPVTPLNATPPVVPLGLPSDLLERRPDIAASERRMAAANEQIGIATAAYYPTISLSGSGGFESTSLSNWFTGPAGFVSGGASAFETIFDAGRRHAVTDQARSAYDQTVADYRQTVLNAFQEVEDNLAALRLLENEAKQQQFAVDAAQHSLDLSTTRYKGGVTTYLEVITAQSLALSDQRTLVQIAGERMNASVSLIRALGGGWQASSLPALQNPSTKPSSSATSSGP
jgi:NodT family efflux transporter outer membrane factor (OMF) lipoprotein